MLEGVRLRSASGHVEQLTEQKHRRVRLATSVLSADGRNRQTTHRTPAPLSWPLRDARLTTPSLGYVTDVTSYALRGLYYEAREDVSLAQNLHSRVREMGCRRIPNHVFERVNQDFSLVSS